MYKLLSLKSIGLFITNYFLNLISTSTGWTIQGCRDPGVVPVLYRLLFWNVFMFLLFLWLLMCPVPVAMFVVFLVVTCYLVCPCVFHVLCLVLLIHGCIVCVCCSFLFSHDWIYFSCLVLINVHCTWIQRLVCLQHPRYR